METAHVQTPASFVTRILRRVRDFESAMEMRPVDHLELRVADLERRLDGRLDQNGGGASNALGSNNTGEA